MLGTARSLSLATILLRQAASSSSLRKCSVECDVIWMSGSRENCKQQNRRPSDRHCNSLQLKTNKSSYLMFTAFMSDPLHQDIYARLHQLWASPSSDGSKWMFQSVIHTSAPSKKRSHTIQKSLNQTRNLAAAAQLLNTCTRKTVYALTGWNTVQHDIWGHAPGFSQHTVKLCVATNAFNRDVSCATLRRCGGKSPLNRDSSVMGHLHFVIVINKHWGVLQPACPQIGTIVSLDGCQRMQNQSARKIRVIVLSFTPPHPCDWESFLVALLRKIVSSSLGL